MREDDRAKQQKEDWDMFTARMESGELDHFNPPTENTENKK